MESNSQYGSHLQMTTQFYNPGDQYVQMFAATSVASTPSAGYDSKPPALPPKPSTSPYGDQQSVSRRNSRPLDGNMQWGNVPIGATKTNSTNLQWDKSNSASMLPTNTQWSNTANSQWDNTGTINNTQWNNSAMPTNSQWTSPVTATDPKWNDSAMPTNSQWTSPVTTTDPKWNTTNPKWNDSAMPTNSQWTSPVTATGTQWNNKVTPTNIEWNNATPVTANQSLEVQQSRRENVMLQNEIERLRQQLQQQDRQSMAGDAWIQENQHLHQQVARLTQENDELRRRASSMESELMVLQHSLKTHKEDFEQERRDRVRIHEEKEKLQQELESQAQVIKMLTEEHGGKLMEMENNMGLDDNERHPCQRCNRLLYPNERFEHMQKCLQ